MIKEFSRPFLLYNGNSCPSKRSSWQVGIGSGNGLALPSTSGDKDLQCNGILLLLARLQWVKAIYANLNHLLNRPKCAASSWLYSSKIQGFLRIGMCYSVWVYLIRIIHYDDVIMTMLASQITSLTVVYSIVYSGVNQRKHQSSASLAFVREIHRGPVNFPHKWPVTRKMFPFDDVIMLTPLYHLMSSRDPVNWNQLINIAAQ